MGLPSSNLGQQTFQATATRNPSFEFGNPQMTMGQQQPNPFQNITPQQPEIQPHFLPPLTGAEAGGLRNYLLGQGHGVQGAFPFRSLF